MRCGEALPIETSQETPASRKRLVLASDADHSRIERDLHDGLQQQLVALAVNLQLLSPLIDSDPEAARALLAEIARDVRQALDDTRRLAWRVHAPLGEAGGLAAALRTAAVHAGVGASVDVAASSPRPTEIDRTVLLCWLAAMEQAGTPGSPSARPPER